MTQLPIGLKPKTDYVETRGRPKGSTSKIELEGESLDSMIGDLIVVAWLACDCNLLMTARYLKVGRSRVYRALYKMGLVEVDVLLSEQKAKKG